MEKYDVVIVGGGPGGYVAAIRAAQRGLKTALVEKENLGGVCLNWGCIPTKALLRNAQTLQQVKEAAQFGIETGEVRADYAAAQARSRQVSAQLVKGIHSLMRKHKVTVIKDTAVFTRPKELLLQDSKRSISGESVIIATGASPAALPFLDYSKRNVLDSRKALSLTELPESLLIIGAGAIGMEFATVFSAYGVRVTVVEMLPHVLPSEDADAAAVLEKACKRRGITLHTGAVIEKVENDGEKLVATLKKGDQRVAIEAAAVLAAAGIRPNSKGLGLEKTGVKLNERGYVVVDDAMRTNVPGVYAIGDITGKLALAHVASAQALQAVDHICGIMTQPLRIENMPRCTYTWPEVASAGLTQAQAADQGYEAKIAVFPLAVNGKSVAAAESEGFVKLVYEKQYGQLLGVFLCGHHVTEMIGGLVGYLGLEMTVEEMAKVVYPHPTVSEAIMEAAHMAGGAAIHL